MASSLNAWLYPAWLSVPTGTGCPVPGAVPSRPGQPVLLVVGPQVEGTGEQSVEQPSVPDLRLVLRERIWPSRTVARAVRRSAQCGLRVIRDG